MFSKICVLFILAASCFGQGPESPRRPGTSPVPLVSSPLPEQDITLTLHLSSELATALENDRRQLFAQKVNGDGATVLTPTQPTLADQLTFRLQDLFRILLQRFPPPSVKQLQDQISEAQRKEAEVREKAATVVRKK